LSGVPPAAGATKNLPLFRNGTRGGGIDKPPPDRENRAAPGGESWSYERAMTYIVMDPCIKCKFMDCVEVCPVDCFYEGENFLAINPEECIDCGVCEPECPVDAIKPDTEDEPDGKWLRINTEYAKVWPNITVKGEPPADREEFERETGKFEKYFSEKPGRGS
jgi:ferredoxin